MNENKSMGMRLYDLRVKAEYTQEDLAYKLNVSRQSVSKWELDKTLPDTQKLIDISHLYNVSIDYIILGKEPKQTLSDLNEHDIDNFNAELMQNNQVNRNEEVSEDNDNDNIVNEKKKLRKIKRIKNYVNFVFATITGCIMIYSIWVVVGLSNNLAFDSNNMESNPVTVEKIYEQYTYAEVSKYNDGNFYNRRVWLDSVDISEGDYIFAFNDKNHSEQIKFEYYRKTLLAPLVVMFMFTILFGYFVWSIYIERKAL